MGPLRLIGQLLVFFGLVVGVVGALVMVWPDLLFETTTPEERELVVESVRPFLYGSAGAFALGVLLIVLTSARRQGPSGATGRRSILWRRKR